MTDIYDEEALDNLEQSENQLTLEALLLMYLLLEGTHAELATELRSFYQKYGKDGVVTYADARKWVGVRNRKKRINVLLLLLNGKFTTLLSKIEPQFNDLINSIIAKEMEFFDVEIEDLKLAWDIDNADWRDRLTADIELWNIQVANDLKQAFHQRKNIEDVLKQLDARFVSMEKVLKRLAITETTAVGSLARHQIFKKLGITKYKFYAREDERTCEQCGSLHGLIFPISAYEVGVTASPVHRNCRCWEVPIRE